MMIWSTRKRGICLLLLISLQYYGAAQRNGYISIDCGASVNYTDPDTGIVWTTDEPYTSTGTNQLMKSVPSSVNQRLVVNQRQLQTLRCFLTNRSKHCYSLPASSNSAYLVRATVLNGRSRSEIGNKFAISIDSTVVDLFDWTANDGYYFRSTEHVVAATSNRVNVCLLPRAGFVCISTIELRPLGYGMYNFVFHGKYLRTLMRVNCGAQSEDPPIRYPHDVYDRIWYTGGELFNTANTATNITVNVSDKPPLAVMQSAWVSSVTVPLEWSVDITYYGSTFYTNYFFAEIQNTGPSDTRIINMDVNGEDSRNNISVGSGTTQINNERNRTITPSSANFRFSASSESVLGPLLNAFDIYQIEVAAQSSTDDKDADALEVVKNIFGLSSWTGDPCLPVPYDWLTCDEGTNPRVTKINLSDFNLVGTIPASMTELTALTDLWLDNNKIRGGIPDLTKRRTHLQNNSLSGGIPSTLASLPLAELFLSNNNLSGPIPAALANQNGLNLDTSGNVDLCAPTANCPVWPIDPSDNNGVGGGSGRRAIDPSDDNGGGGGRGRNGALIGAISGGVVVVLATNGLLVWLYYRTRPKPTPPLASIRVDDLGFKEQGSEASRSGSAAAAVEKARAFTLSEVQEATQEKKILGKGGFGTVLYGKLLDGTEVAVKVNSATSHQGTREFLKEVSILSRVHHNNLVFLLGYCEENGNRILIYEFMTKGTLREHLHGEGMKEQLTWKQRLQIALDAANGLEYLHNHCIPKIIHRDIKSSNILLDTNEKEKRLAKVADFGISKLAPEDQTASMSTEIRGTHGYFDPEYTAKMKLTEKSDVYSFGVVLLEIICGRPPAYSDAEHDSLVEWARSQWNKSDFESLVDPTIRGTYNVPAMREVVELAMGCVEPLSVNRRVMKQVVRGLTVASELEHGAR